MSSVPAINPINNKPFSPKSRQLREKAQNLPVSKDLAGVVEDFKANQVLILVGETGSGKTTQVPPAVLHTLRQGQKAALTQPRVLACRLIGARLAEEHDVQVGEEIGISCKGTHLVSKGVTQLEVLTDGSLVAAAKRDPTLSEYDIVIVDEAHQHSGDTDILLGLLKQLVTKRSDLKVIIMSATIDTHTFKNFFSGSVVRTVPGRTYPVQVKYLSTPSSQDTMLSDLARQIIEAHMTEQAGDILVFVSGKYEIVHLPTMLYKIIYGDDTHEPAFPSDEIGDISVFPLHAGLPMLEQATTLESISLPPRFGKTSRKVILATNIAETSVTIPGVTIVIDSLQYKALVWNPENESYGLLEFWVSQAVSQQRIGRAGRTRPGVAYRMCTQTGFTELAKHTIPSMQNSDMIQECLTVIRMKFNPLAFPFMSAPATETVARALGILTDIGAIKWSARGLELLPRGRAISGLPVSVWGAVMILESTRLRCQDAIISLVSMIEAISTGDMLYIDDGLPDFKLRKASSIRHFGRKHGDHIQLLNVYLAWRNAEFDGNQPEFLAKYLLNEKLLKAAHETRMLIIKYMTSVEGVKTGWVPGGYPPESSQYYIHVLLALAAGSCTRVARRVPNEKMLWEAVRSGDKAELTLDGCHPAAGQDWIVYDTHQNPGPGSHELRLVTPIPLNLIILGLPTFWSKRNLGRDCPISNDIATAITQLTDSDDAGVRQTMPCPPPPATTSPQ